MKRIVRFLALLFFASVPFSTPVLFAQHVVTQLSALSRSGAQSGTSFDMIVDQGVNLDEVTSLHFSHPGISAEIKSLDPLPHSENRRPHYGHFSVTVSEEVPSGRYEVRAAGRHGVSNPRAFLVNRLIHLQPATISHDPTQPTELPVDTLIHAKASSAEIDFFRIELAEQRSLHIDLLAQRIDSRMIGQLKLYDTAGRIIASARGADEADPSLTRANLSPGQYLLAVHDFTYRGGNEFPYQIVLRDQANAGDHTDDDTVPGHLPRHAATRVFTLPGSFELSLTQDPVQGPREIDLPYDATHEFPPDHDDSVFQFRADEGDVYAIDIVSDRVGQPTDARLILQHIEEQANGPPKLHEVLRIDDSQSIGDGAIRLFSKDPVSLFRMPLSTKYQLTIRDLDVGQSLSLRQGFALRIRQPNPGFDLIAYRSFPHRDVNQSAPFGSKLYRGGAETIRVFAIRRDGWTGPIHVLAQNLPAGVHGGDGIIAANQQQTELIVNASEDAPSAIATPLQIIGRSEDGAITEEAVPATILWGKGGGRDYIRSRLATNLFLSVSELDLAPLSFSLGDGSPIEVKKGQTVALDVKAIRRAGGDASCVLRGRDLPPAVTGKDVTMAADKSEAKYEIKVAPNAPVGTYSLWLQAETKIKVKPNPQSHERARQYRSHLQKLHDDPAQAANLESIKAAIAEADKMVEASKGGSKDQSLTVFIPTSSATLRVIEP